MNIVHYLKRMRLSDGGVVRCVLDMTALLAARGHRVTLLTTDATDVPEDWNENVSGTPTLVTLPAPSAPLGRFTSEGLESFAAAIRDAEALHLHAMWDPTNTQAARLANAKNIPYILSIHGMLDDWCMSQKSLKKRIYHALVEKKLLSKAAAVHSTAQGELDQACKWFPKSHGRVVPLVFDLEPFNPGPGASLARESIPGFDRGHPTVLFISRLHVKKGVEHLIRAAAILAERRVGVTFLVAGTGDEGYTRSLHVMAEQLCVTDSVLFLGMVSGDTKFSLLQAADISLLPTSQENFGFSVVEGMAGGAPIVTTKGVDIWPELEKSGGAILTTQDPMLIADAIEQLVNDPAQRQSMGDAAKKWVFDTFAGDSIVKRYEELYTTARAAHSGDAS